MDEHAKAARKLKVQFNHDVTREQVFAAMEVVFRGTGCLACGIRGIDLNLLAGDPDPQFGGLSGLSGVAGVIAG